MLAPVLAELVAKYAPEWRLTSPSARVREPGVVELRGALPETMHFGSARLDLDRGVLVFVDEDHRDGGDFEERRVAIDADELARARAALSAAT